MNERHEDADGVAAYVRTDPAQPWTPEHCRNYPTEAAALLNARGATVSAFRQGNWSHPDLDGSRIVGWRIPAADVERMGADAYCLPQEVSDALAKLSAAHGVLASDEANGKRSTSAATASGHELPNGTAAAQAAASLPVANGGDARVASAGCPPGVPAVHGDAKRCEPPMGDTGIGGREK